jgi:hypothetical protein
MWRTEYTVQVMSVDIDSVALVVIVGLALLV